MIDELGPNGFPKGWADKYKRQLGAETLGLLNEIDEQQGEDDE
ncbi:MAG TPA: hypothetical protein PLU21_03915 [Candidatus Saccharibacteria bacterium]|nr:hypothetical protein [Candidatus Saccharibacteria bacterium]